MQDAHQSQVQREQRRDLKHNQCQVIADYASKKVPVRAEMTQADGYAGLGSISHYTLTTTFLAREEDCPGMDAAERAETFITITDNLVCDDAAQNAVHAAQGVKGAIKLRTEQHPHLDEVFLWTDGATDYAGVIFVVAMLMCDTKMTAGATILKHEHSIPGEGKAVNDMKNGLLAQIMKKFRRRSTDGADQQTAGKLASAFELAKMAGVQNSVAEVARFEVDIKAPHNIAKYYSKEREDAESVRFRCYSDIGSGVVIKIECSAGDMTKLEDANAKLTIPASLDESASSRGATLQKQTRQQRKQHRDAKDAAKIAKRTEANEKAAEDPLQQKRAQHQRGLAGAAAELVLQCPTCDRSFNISKRSDFDAHVEKCSAKPTHTPVPDQILQRVGEVTRAEEKRFADLRLFELVLDTQAALQSLCLVARGRGMQEVQGMEGLQEVQGMEGLQEEVVEEEEEEQELVIGDAVTSRDAFIQMRAAPGSMLLLVDGDEGIGPNGAWQVIDTFPVTLMFETPPLPVCPRGWARKAPRRPTLILPEG